MIWLSLWVPIWLLISWHLPYELSCFSNKDEKQHWKWDWRQWSWKYQEKMNKMREIPRSETHNRFYDYFQTSLLVGIKNRGKSLQLPSFRSDSGRNHKWGMLFGELYISHELRWRIVEMVVADWGPNSSQCPNVTNKWERSVVVIRLSMNLKRDGIRLRLGASIQPRAI